MLKRRAARAETRGLIFGLPLCCGLTLGAQGAFLHARSAAVPKTQDLYAGGTSKPERPEKREMGKIKPPMLFILFSGSNAI